MIVWKFVADGFRTCPDTVHVFVKDDSTLKMRHGSCKGIQMTTAIGTSVWKWNEVI